ncbi:maestro heat-like repeat-containing protein family member 7 isoform X2 [Patagioenas fasciata]
MEFLKCIAMIFRDATYNDLSQGLDLFCQRYELVENIEVLLEEEPRDQLPTVVQRIAAFAMADMSFVEEVLEGKDRSHIQACFSSVFMLPPKEEMRDLKPYLYFMTMKAVDSMLVALVLNSPASQVSEKMQDIFQMLLTFSTSERASVRERAVGRMRLLSFLLTNYSSLKADPNEDRDDSGAEIQMPILGQLLGHLLLFLSFKEEETSCLALDTLCFLFQFKCQQHCVTVPEENAQLQEDWEAEVASLTSSSRAPHITKLFAEHLQPSDRTDMVLVFIEALTDSSTFDKKAARNMLDMVKRDCDFWLVDVPKITSCIHKTLGCINTAPARQRVVSLIVWMADKCPGEVVSTLLTIAPPADSTALALWEVMFSVPQTLQNVLKELHIQLQDRHRRVLHTCWEDTSILRLAILASNDLQDEEFAPMYLIMRFLRQRRPKVLSLVLRGLMTLSEREEMARKMKVMLPDLSWVLQYGNNVIKTKALVVFRNVMAQLEREEASPIAVVLAKLLLPFFDDELSQLRKFSISLFRDLMKMVVENDKRKMKNTVQLGLLPLFFHMSDQVQSVAKVAREALLDAAELLKWKQLGHLVQTQQTWRTGESLLERDRSRAQELLRQSLPYLRDPQASLQEAALRFIGLAVRHLRDPSKESLSEICRAIQPLEEETDPSISSLATQTIVTVCSSWKRPRSRWSLRALCCWR